MQELKSYARRPKTGRIVKEPQVEGEGEVFSNISDKCTNINVFTVCLSIVSSVKDQSHVFARLKIKLNSSILD